MGKEAERLKLTTPRGKRVDVSKRKPDGEIVSSSLQRQKDRATNHRQRTLEERDRYMAAMCGTSPQLFECVIIVSLEISPEITTCIIAALLGEQRILLADNTVCTVSKLVQVMGALIQPLCWPHVFIPAVPDNLLDLCHNPTPYLMGILRNNLALIHKLIIADQSSESAIDQLDFVFIDADNGLVNPPPEPYAFNSNFAAWKQQIILLWYASLFGHYKTISGECEWGSEFKRRLVEAQPDKSVRPYLSYLSETVMFHEWVVKRCSKAPESSDPLPGSEEFLNGRIDKLYSAGVNCFSTRPLTKMINKVSKVLRAKK
ncbi:unnamed protein product [Angiostrongylus costaricensis]|uniref:UDENN domain-containing protein n=1 Tax=Angiostrongylus costaricensis TaxID=334426 RepID=A0A158PJZ1_ANGCS|nr:unnamed protein product [Angiostrongylus costaricensis]